ncbi:hypothetical protein OSB04_014057 [Centaurea solstitialis]|uniref:Protein kinase domain-containing protein n=1 Tax=Centaurea solstitialis TaxID=347529 RepID=A0AA38TLZ4_9ASTR|nr:hypothetical protein OSB04_014057 [Centaurea solstitialis]
MGLPYVGTVNRADSWSTRISRMTPLSECPDTPETSGTAIQTQPTSATTFYTAYSNFNLPNFEAEKTNNLRVFTFAELKTATNDFDDCHRFEDGTNGSAYKGVIKSLEHPFTEIEVVVKDTNEKLEYRLLSTWLVVVDHPNFVKAIGHCFEYIGRNRTPWFLVYEYMSNRSIGYHLSTSCETPLSWNIRLKVAQDIARGLAYLHQQTNSKVTFGFFTCFNVLLDNHWNAKLWNFWFSRFIPEEGFSRARSMATNTGYVDGEIQTRDLPPTHDVWSYGVFLYELITGRLRLDTDGTKNEQDLVEWVKPYIGSESFELIIDPRLEGNYSLESVQKLSFIANKCLSIDPMSRPNMSEALEMVNQLMTGVPSQPPPLDSLVSVVAIEQKMVFTDGKKTPEKTKSEGERGSTKVQSKKRKSTKVKRKESALIANWATGSLTERLPVWQNRSLDFPFFFLFLAKQNCSHLFLAKQKFAEATAKAIALTTVAAEATSITAVATAATAATAEAPTTTAAED